MERERLGLDWGNVITKVGGVGDTFFGNKYLESIQVEGAFQAIRKLITQRGERRQPGQFDAADTFIISRADPASALRTLHWLEHHNFYQKTGFLDENNIFFCLERGDKAPIAERLELTHFIDDRLEVLKRLKKVRRRFAFCPSEREVQYHGDVLSEVTRVGAWSDILGHLLPGERQLPLAVPEVLRAA